MFGAIRISTNSPVNTATSPTSFRWAPTGNPAEKGTTQTLSAGATSKRRGSARRAGVSPRWRASVRRARSSASGVTLIELLIVLTLIALVTGISYPSAASSVESLRLRSVSDQVVSFLNTAIDRAGRREQVIEVWIAPKDNVLIARSPDLAYSRRLELPDGYRILAVLPAAEVNPDEPRRFLMHPGGTIPRIGVEIANRAGTKRMVSVDPFTELTRAEKVP
jgi:prepilin-type N-terminal cleavage/methylation domain-containing protein